MAAKFVSSSQLQQLPTLVSAVGCKNLARSHSTISIFNNTQHQRLSKRRRLVFSSPSNSNGRFSGNAVRPISATGSGFEASITDANDSVITMKDANVVVESQDENTIQLRVDLAGDVTDKVFGKILKKMALTAPPIPGFRRQKGGKTTRVPREFLVQILGEDRVTNFVIQEIVSVTLADFANKASVNCLQENLKVKENKVTTTQTAEELKKLFEPGKEFAFNATLELEPLVASEAES
ncbi:Trigger factor [Linum perenne]